MTRKVIPGTMMPERYGPEPATEPDEELVTVNVEKDELWPHFDIVKQESHYEAVVTREFLERYEKARKEFWTMNQRLVDVMEEQGLDPLD